MSKRVRRLIAVPGIVAVAGLGLTACGNAATSPGAAALVGDVRISVTTLQKAVDRALANPQAQTALGSDRASFTRKELSQLIRNVVDTAAAAAHGVSVSQNEVQQQLAQFAQQAGGLQQLQQQAAQAGVPAQDLPTFIRYYVLEQKLADSLVAKVPVTQQQLQAAYNQNINQFDQVDSAHILVKDKNTADRILAQVRKSPTSFAALAKRYSIDTGSKNSGGNLGFAGRQQFVTPFSNAIFAAKPGSFIEVHTQFGWHVIHVIAHRKLSLAQATPQLKADILKNERSQLLQQALAQEAKKLGVHVNPRYGRWDPKTDSVVAISPKNDITSPAPSSGSG